MPKPIPTLSAVGYVTEIVDKAERAMLNFCVSQGRQSTLYRGFITSLPSLVQRHGGNPGELRDTMETTLRNYLNRLFDEAQVSVSYEIKDSRTQLSLNVWVRDDSLTHNLGYLISTSNNQVLSVFAANNGTYIYTR